MQAMVQDIKHSEGTLEQILFAKFNDRLYAVLAFVLSLSLIPLKAILPAYALLIFISFINFLIVVSLVRNRLGLIPCSRYLFLVAPGYLQLLVYVVTSGNVSVAILANNYINENLIFFVATISTIGAASGNLGFFLKPMIIKFLVPSAGMSKGVSYFFLLFFIIFAIYYGSSLGKSLLETKQYATNTEATKTVIGVINVFFFYFLSLFFVYRFWLYNKFSISEYKIDIAIILLVIGYVALRGVRQDSIGLLLGLFAISVGYKRVKKKKALYYLVFILFFVSWVGSTFTGALREDATSATVTSLITNIPFFIFSKGYVIFNMNTASMTIGTLNIIPYKLMDTGYLFGESFLNWLPRTLPEFLLSSRPEGPEFAMHYNGVWFGWGGIHEIAEEYWNFSYLGVIILPMFFSYCLNSIGKSFLRSRSFLMAIPIVWLVMMPRWTWYQIFALYKSTLTMVVIAFLLFFLFESKKQEKALNPFKV